MRLPILLSVLLLGLVAPIARAGDDEPRGALDRIAQLEHDLRVARREAEVRRSTNVHLLGLLDDVFARLRKAEAPRHDLAAALSKEVDRLRWNFQRGAALDTVAASLSHVPAAHWLGELASGDATRAGVALSVLAVLPDPSPAGVAAQARAAAARIRAP